MTTGFNPINRKFFCFLVKFFVFRNFLHWLFQKVRIKLFDNFIYIYDQSLFKNKQSRKLGGWIWGLKAILRIAYSNNNFEVSKFSDFILIGLNPGGGGSHFCDAILEVLGQKLSLV